MRCAALLALALLGAPMLAALAPAEPKPDPAFPFSREIEAFAQLDRQGALLADATLFLGSSSIRLWDIGRSFPGMATVNRGFGGATTPDVLHHYRRLLPTVPPRNVMVYVGENDLAGGATPDAVARQVLDLLGRLRADYPRARIAYLSLKPSPIRWTLWPRMDAVNRAVGARARRDGFDYIDVGHVLLAKDGLPDASLFRPDGLHMNPDGYARWTALVQAYLGNRSVAQR
jgi:lysophospholipase L1-like esterase